MLLYNFIIWRNFTKFEYLYLPNESRLFLVPFIARMSLVITVSLDELVKIADAVSQPVTACENEMLPRHFG